MIIQIGTEVDESRVLWKYKESDEWERADIDDLIRAYENRPQGEWIPVSERLPKYRETVLISTKWGVTIAYRDSIVEGVTDDYWDCPVDDSTIVSRYVTAWQPLPEPYKGGDSE